jgi:hypothetical protein
MADELNRWRDRLSPSGRRCLVKPKRPTVALLASKTPRRKKDQAPSLVDSIFAHMLLGDNGTARQLAVARDQLARDVRLGRDGRAQAKLRRKIASLERVLDRNIGLPGYVRVTPGGCGVHVQLDLSTAEIHERLAAAEADIEAADAELAMLVLEGAESTTWARFRRNWAVREVAMLRGVLKRRERNSG